MGNVTHLFSLVYIAVLFAVQRIGGQCDSEWILTSDKTSCLFFSGADDELDFQGAEAECEARDATLSSLSNQHEWEFIIDTIQNDTSRRQVCEAGSTLEECVHPAKEFWIGLKRSYLQVGEALHVRRMNWYWLDKTPYTYRDSPSNWVRLAWDKGKPNEEPTGDSKCVRMKKNGQLADIRCDTIIRYICKKESTIKPIEEITVASTTQVSSKHTVGIDFGETSTQNVTDGSGIYSPGSKPGELAFYSIPIIVVVVAVVIGITAWILIRRRRQKSQFDPEEGTLNNLNQPVNSSSSNSRAAAFFDNNLENDNLNDGVKRLASYEAIKNDPGQVEFKPKNGRQFTANGVVLNKYDNVYVNDQNAYSDIQDIDGDDDDDDDKTADESHLNDRTISENVDENVYEDPDHSKKANGVIGNSVLPLDVSNKIEPKGENLVTAWQSTDSNSERSGAASLLSGVSESTASELENNHALPRKRPRKVTFEDPQEAVTIEDDSLYEE